MTQPTHGFGAVVPRTESATATARCISRRRWPLALAVPGTVHGASDLAVEAPLPLAQ